MLKETTDEHIERLKKRIDFLRHFARNSAAELSEAEESMAQLAAQLTVAAKHREPVPSSTEAEITRIGVQLFARAEFRAEALAAIYRE